MQRAKFGDEGGGRGGARCKFSAISCSLLPIFSFPLSHLSPLSKLEPGSLPLSLSLTVLRTIIALRTAQRARRAFVFMHLQFSLSNESVASEQLPYEWATNYKRIIHPRK